MASEPDFTIGIEEEYLLVDRDTMALAEAPEAMMEVCRAELGEQVSPEFLQCQVEIGTTVCAGVTEARADLKRLRACIADAASTHNLAPIAVSCHPFADWKDQHHTDKERYNDLRRALAGVAKRMLICGMHVHVGIAEERTRIDLVNQLTYFLPHLLAMSASSPFWQGFDTGLSSYRLTVFDNLPRTGLPPYFASWDEYQNTVGVLIDLDVIEDTSKIWWDLRPSARFPTIEARICDVAPRLEDTLSLAAVTQCLTRMLWRLSAKNQRWRIYDRFLVAENRWRAQRFGTAEGLIDFGRRDIVPFAELAGEVVELLAEDAGVLRCTPELERVPAMVAAGTSADRQRQVHAAALAAGAGEAEALRAVVAHLIEEYREGL
ncbi:MAG: carboxylate-amine ligase [Paracoccaceae bacterium]|nr:carboxylate-amine ligase [Paracoccaceae bacterium]